MGYKSDINLFKAAGGSVAKGKKMPITKKLLICLVAVIFICGAVIGLLTYMNSSQTKELKKLVDQKNSYEFTKRLTQSLIKDYNNVTASKDSLSFIEYYNELSSGLFSPLTEEELTAIKGYMLNNGYTTDFSFTDVAEELKKQIALAPYKIDSNDDNAALLQESYKLLYSAISSMIEYPELFADLPEQNENDIWYSYFRGQFVAVVQGAGDYRLLLQGLTDSAQTGVNPFLGLDMETDTGAEKLTEAYGLTINIEGVDYTVISITRRTIVERLFDAIEDRIKIALENEYDQTGVEYKYSIGKLEVSTRENTISFQIRATQSEVFGLEDIVYAIDGSPFFKAEKDLVFDFEDGASLQEAELVFTIENYAKDAMQEIVKTIFANSETEGE